MSNKGHFKPPDKVFRHTVATILTTSDYEAVKRLAAAQSVSMSTYVRSIVVDAIADENARPKERKKFQFRTVWRAIGACADNAPIWFLQAECDGAAKVWSDDEVPYCMIRTRTGMVRVDDGDWIVQEPDGFLAAARIDVL
jgi:hypothetical protein